MANVFISYPHEAAKEAALLASALEEKGVKSYRDFEINPGMNIPEGIGEALQRSEAVAFLVTRDAEPSEWVRQEFSIALESYWSGSTKLLVPVLIGRETEPPSFLRQWNSLRVEKKADWAKAAEQLSIWVRDYQSIKNQPSTKEVAERRNRLKSIDRQVLHWRKTEPLQEKRLAVAPDKAAKSAMHSGVPTLASRKTKVSKAKR
jgi:TIR domain